MQLQESCLRDQGIGIVHFFPGFGVRKTGAYSSLDSKLSRNNIQTLKYSEIQQFSGCAGKIVHGNSELEVPSNRQKRKYKVCKDGCAGDHAVGTRRVAAQLRFQGNVNFFRP